MSGVERRFLGWEAPPMGACAAALVGMAGPGWEVDLSRVLVVVQGGRAGRNLRLHLVEQAEGSGRALVPPRIVTPAGLVGALIPAEGPAAPALLRWGAWARAMRERPAGGSILAEPPSDLMGWLRAGAMLEQAAAHLAGHGLTFAGAEAGAREAARFSDADRWEVLPELERAALAALAETGFEHAELARVGRGVEVRGPIVLACVSDLSGLARRALREAAERESVTALVAAPASLADRFDELGCPGAAWAEANIDLEGASIRVVDDATDQADAALEAVESLGESVPPDGVIIAAPDRSVIPRLERRAALAGARVRDAAGARLLDSRPGTLLAAAAELIASGTFRALGTFVRHADAEARISAVLGTPAHEWLAAMDSYEVQHLPREIGGEWLASKNGEEGSVGRVGAAVEQLLGELGGKERRSPGEWAGPIVGMLARIYGGRPLNADVPADAALAESLAGLREHAASLGDWPREWGELSGAEAIGAVLMLAEEGAIAPPPDPGAIEVVGWLEAALDDAPAVIVTGMNEGFVPGREAPSPLLPESVRAALGMAGSRPARDAFLLTLLLRSRGHVTLIAGRRGDDGEARLPSRLLLRCAGRDLAARVLLWAPPEGAALYRPRRPPPAGVPGATGGFEPMPLADRRAPRPGMGVTDFGAYLRSPYLFYLERELRLREVPEHPVELDQRAFGELLHEVLRSFAAGPEQDSQDAGRIERFVLTELERAVRERHGATPTAPVMIQAAQARERLKGFARWQAERAAQGWRIAESEWRPGEPSSLEVDGEAVSITGRIDRIDRHEELGWALLDYKTGDRMKKPEKTHRCGGEWIDLQLPLYRLLAQPLTGGEAVALGYVLLPASAKGTCLEAAEWDEAALEGALEAAREVVRRVRRGEFRLAGPLPREQGTFAALCGTLHVGGAADEPAEGEQPEGEADD